MEKEVIEWTVNKKLSDGRGINPSIACNQFGHLIVIFKSPNNAKLKFHFGSLTDKHDTVMWNPHVTYEDGSNPSCCFAGYLVATVHVARGQLWNRTAQIVKEMAPKPALPRLLSKIPKTIFNDSKILRVNYGSIVTLLHVKTGKHMCTDTGRYKTGSKSQRVFLNELSSLLDSTAQFTLVPAQEMEGKRRGQIRFGELVRLSPLKMKNSLYSDSSYKSPLGNGQEICCSTEGEKDQMDNFFFQSPFQEECLHTNSLFRLAHTSGRHLSSDGQVAFEEGKIQVFLSDETEDKSQSFWVIEKCQDRNY